MHGLLNFPRDTHFAAPIRFGLGGHTFKVHQQQRKTFVEKAKLSKRKRMKDVYYHEVSQPDPTPFKCFLVKILKYGIICIVPS